jgi:hypothetical protein
LDKEPSSDETLLTSTPSFVDFDPTIIPFQNKVIYDIDFGIDWSLGVHEFLFSGSVGSSKSLLGAHLAIKHCLKYPGARVLLARRALPDLKDTIYKKVVEHLAGSSLIEGKHYHERSNTADIEFYNGSEIISKSWADKKYIKLRSLELSIAIVEEAVENKGDDYQAIKEIRQRVGRLPHIKESYVAFLTNPDSPSHPLYKDFFEKVAPRRKVYYSLTEQNPFLPKTYIDNLRQDMTEKESRRMLNGEWIEIDKDRLYYEYDSTINYKKETYNIVPSLPVALSFDFNMTNGKPMSCALDQFDPKTDSFHFFDEVSVHGARTESLLEEIAERGILDAAVKFEICGDASGAFGSTKSKYSDYEIILDYLRKYRTKTGQPLSYEMLVPKANPPIRTRHNLVNAYCKNANKQHRLFVYEKAQTIHKGLMFMALAKGATIIEDQTIEGQDITTAVGYRVVYKHNNKNMIKAGNIT